MLGFAIDSQALMASYIDDHGTYWILDREQLVCLASPRRHDILDRLVPSGPLSIKELADAIGADPPSLYHHIKKMLAVGLVIPADARVVNRRREQLYDAPARRMRLTRALEDPDNREVFVQICASLCREMDRDFRRGAEARAARTGGPGKNLGFSRLIGSPTPEGLAEINRKLEEIAAIIWDSPRGGGELVGISWVLAPIETGDSED